MKNRTETIIGDPIFVNKLKIDLRSKEALIELKEYQISYSAMTLPDMKADYLKGVEALKRKAVLDLQLSNYQQVKQDHTKNHIGL